MRSREPVTQSPLLLGNFESRAAWQGVADVIGGRYIIDRQEWGADAGVLTFHEPGATEPAIADHVSGEGYARLVPVAEGCLLDVSFFRHEAVDLPPPWLNPAWRNEQLPSGTPLAPGESFLMRDTRQEAELLVAIQEHLASGSEVWPSELIGDATVAERPWLRQTLDQVVGDYRNFYSVQGLKPLVLGVGVAALIANTQLDREVEEKYQAHFRSAETNALARITKPIGNGNYAVPILAGVYALTELTDSLPVAGEWSNRSLRAFAVGFPPMLLLQKVTGAERPLLDHSSRWTPWKNDHGVSGHAFMGAIPFLAAASMTDDPYWKAGLVAGSMLTGWSRVNDNQHFLSQALLGWWLAWLAVRAVDETNRQEEQARLVPLPPSAGTGVGLEFRY